MTDALLAAYDDAAQATQRAITSLGNLTLGLNLQPTVIATLPTTVHLTEPEHLYMPVLPAARPITRPRPGRIEQSLRTRSVSEPALLARAADIAAAAEDLVSAITPPSQRRAAVNRAALRALNGSNHDQQPARLAAEDSAPTTASRHPLPKLVPINHQIRHRITTRHRQTPTP